MINLKSLFFNQINFKCMIYQTHIPNNIHTTLNIICVYYFNFNNYDFVFVFFFFNDTANTEIYTLSLHDALPIFAKRLRRTSTALEHFEEILTRGSVARAGRRSEEHTSELQSHVNLVCRLLL